MNDPGHRDASPANVERLVSQLREDPRSLVYVELAEAYVRVGRVSEAIEVCQRGLATHPDHLPGRLALARAYVTYGRYKEAQAELLKVVKADRSNRHGFALLGEVLLARGDHERAQAILVHAHDLDPADARVLELLRRAREGTAGDTAALPPGVAAPAAAGADNSAGAPARVRSPHPDILPSPELGKDYTSDVITLVQNDAAKLPGPAPSAGPRAGLPGVSRGAPEPGAARASPASAPAKSTAAVRGQPGARPVPPSAPAAPAPRKPAFDEEPTKVANDDYVAEQMKLIESAWEKELDASQKVPLRPPAGVEPDVAVDARDFSEDAPTVAATPGAREAAREFDEDVPTKRAAPGTVLGLGAVGNQPAAAGAGAGARAAKPALIAPTVPKSEGRPDTLEISSRDVVEERPAQLRDDSKVETMPEGARTPDRDDEVQIEDDDEPPVFAPAAAAPRLGLRDGSAPKMPFPPAPSAPLHAEAAFRSAAIGLTPARGKPAQATTKLSSEERRAAIVQDRVGIAPSDDAVLNAMLGGSALDFPGVEHRMVRRDPTLTTQEEKAFNIRRERSFWRMWAVLFAIAATVGGAWGYTYVERNRQVAARYEDARARVRLGTYDGYTRAKEDYQTIVKLDTRDDRAAGELAAMYALPMIDYGDDLESAVQTMTRRAEQQLSRHHGTQVPAGLALARAALALRRGEVDKVREIVVKADTDHNDDPRLPYVAALGRAAAGDAAGARGLLAESVKRDPRYVPALVALGGVYADQGDFDRSEEAYRKALAIAPDHPRAVLGRALLRIDRGQDLDRATADLNVTLQKAADISPPMAAWRKLGLGELHLKLGDTDKAAQNLDAAARGMVEDPRFLIRLARARLDQGRVSDAERLLRRVARQRPGRDPQVEAVDAEIALAKGFEDRVVAALAGRDSGPPRIKVALGRAQYALGKLKEAAEALQQALKDIPEDPTALVYRALVRAAEHEGSWAERELEKLARAQASTLPRYALGKLALERGDLERAKQHLQVALTGNPETYRAALLLAKIDQKQGRIGEAIKVLERAVADNASFVPARAQLGLLHAEVGRWRAARSELKGASESGGKTDADLLLALARAQVELGFVDECASTLQKAQEKGASSPRLEQLKAVAASWQDGQAPAAARRLEGLRKQRPHDVRLLVDIGTAWRRAGNAKLSEGAFQQAVGLDSDSVDARLGLAKLRLLAGDPPRAVAAYRDAEAAYRRRSYLAQEKLVEAKIGLGRAYLLPGPERAADKAKKALEEAVAMDPEDPEAQYYLGRLYLDTSELPRARDALARAVELDPQFADAHFYLAEAIGKADPARARRGYDKYLELAPKGDHAKAARKALETLK